MNFKETELETRLRRAKDAMKDAMEKRRNAEIAAHKAREDYEKSKDKFDELFALNEQALLRALKAEYLHCTK